MDFMGLNGHEMGYEWNIGRISWDLAVGNLLSNGFCGSDSELGVSYSLQKKGSQGATNRVSQAYDSSKYLWNLYSGI